MFWRAACAAHLSLALMDYQAIQRVSADTQQVYAIFAPTGWSDRSEKSDHSLPRFPL
jgi:hypothetical protein